MFSFTQCCFYDISILDYDNNNQIARSVYSQHIVTAQTYFPYSDVCFYPLTMKQD